MSSHMEITQATREITQATRPNEGQFNVQSQRRHHPRRIINVKRVRRNVAAIASLYASREARGQSTPHLIHVMKYMVPTVVVLVTLKYEAKTESLFRENPAPLWCFIAATGVYWLIVGAMKQMKTLKGICFKILSRAALASGVLSTLSLVSIFLPYPCSLVPLLIWIPLPVVLAWPKAYALIHRGITSVINKIHAIVVWARGRNSREEASLPV